MIHSQEDLYCSAQSAIAVLSAARSEELLNGHRTKVCTVRATKCVCGEVGHKS